ncbi:galanin receptor type 1-like [Diadema antillarum]|uniref:galanin receptor type 1-like n=1 Tax=Diadema antillarum TaxID=105358 RepID=UPI003A8A8F8B
MEKVKKATSRSSPYPPTNPYSYSDTEDKLRSERPLETSWLCMFAPWTWMTVLQLTTATVGVIGNLIVILVVFGRRHKCRPTDTLIGALAVADFSTSIFMIPLPHCLRVPPSWLGETFCKIIYPGMLKWISVDASIYTLALIPLERYLAIAYPFQFRHFITRVHVRYVITGVWLFALLLNVFIASTSMVKDGECTHVYPSQTLQLARGLTTFSVELLVPAIIMLITQAMTVIVLHRQGRLRLAEDKTTNSSKLSSRHHVAKKRVLQMLFIVVVVFIVSWAPAQTTYVAYNLNVLPASFFLSPLGNCLIVLPFSNSCANPIIYTIRNREFRMAIKDLFKARGGSSVGIFSDKTQPTTIRPQEH